jgi:hypothetical protein
MNPLDQVEFVPFTSCLEQPTLLTRFIRWVKNEPAEQEPQLHDDPGNYSPCDPEVKLREYQQILPDAKSIYIFRNGNCVFSKADLTESDAIALLKAHGPIHLGTPSADYAVAILTHPIRGFVVKYDHPQILSFFNADEYPLDCPLPLAGSMIRLSREMDGQDLRVVASYQSEN